MQHSNLKNRIVSSETQVSGVMYNDRYNISIYTQGLNLALGHPLNQTVINVTPA